VAYSLWLGAAPAVAELSCHLHAPADLARPAAPPQLTDIPAASAMPVYATTLACDEANALLYQGRGRCHCRFDAGSGSGMMAPPPIEPSGAQPLP
jgi:hypothetical protein